MARGKLLQTDEVWNFYQSGMSIAEIARMYQVNQTTVSYHIKKKREEYGSTQGIQDAG